MIERDQIERQVIVFQRMRDLMCDLAAEHRSEGNENAARHCAGVAEGLSVGEVTLRCLLENKPTALVPAGSMVPRLEVVS